MGKHVNRFGKIVFWLSWPALHVILRIGSRTRVMVIAEDHVLLVKDIIGSGRWSLPGGGLKFGEQPLNGALRELREETSLELEASQLSAKGTHRGSNDDGHAYRYHLFLARLPKKLPVKRQARELSDICWMPLKQATSSPDVGRVSREALAHWI